MRTLLAVAVASTLLSGCALQVGEDEFSCPNSSPGAACSSARQIHDLTNSRNSLEGLKVAQGKILGRVDEDGDLIEPDEDESPKTVVRTTSSKATPAVSDVYKPVPDDRRQDHFPPAELVENAPIHTPKQPLPLGAVEGVEQEHGRLMTHVQSPSALAPEPLAVLQQPKNMRILVSSWVDKQGDLHMPGYVFVEVQPRQWVVGSQANDRPARIIPLQVIQKSQEETRRQQKAQRGATSIGVTESR